MRNITSVGHECWYNGIHPCVIRLGEGSIALIERQNTHQQEKNYVSWARQRRHWGLTSECTTRMAVLAPSQPSYLRVAELSCSAAIASSPMAATHTRQPSLVDMAGDALPQPHRPPRGELLAELATSQPSWERWLGDSYFSHLIWLGHSQCSHPPEHGW